MLVIFPVLFCFFLLYLELQRSDDDADSALWVCSSAGAAQRYPPSNQKGGTRKHAIPTPHSLWPVGCGPLPTLNQPSSQMPPNLRRNWLLNLAYLSSTLSYSMTNALLSNVFTSQCSHWLLWSLNSPQTPPFCSEKLGTECVPVWCCRCSARGCWSAAVSLGHSASAAAKYWPLPRARSRSFLWCIVVVMVAIDTHPRARMELLRMHYRDHHLHEVSSIPGCEISFPHRI